VSTERDLLRDYATEAGFVGQRFQLATKAFSAIDNVLDLIEKAESMGVKRVDVSGLRDAIRKGLT
jgi:hypothetical protein